MAEGVRAVDKGKTLGLELPGERSSAANKTGGSGG
jgi:hypothetical protein